MYLRVVSGLYSGSRAPRVTNYFTLTVPLSDQEYKTSELLGQPDKCWLSGGYPVIYIHRRGSRSAYTVFCFGQIFQMAQNRGKYILESENLKTFAGNMPLDFHKFGNHKFSAQSQVNRSSFFLDPCLVHVHVVPSVLFTVIHDLGGPITGPKVC